MLRGDSGSSHSHIGAEPTFRHTMQRGVQLVAWGVGRGTVHNGKPEYI